MQVCAGRVTDSPHTAVPSSSTVPEFYSNVCELAGQLEYCGSSEIRQDEPDAGDLRGIDFVHTLARYIPGVID